MAAGPVVGRQAGLAPPLGVAPRRRAPGPRTARRRRSGSGRGGPRTRAGRRSGGSPAPGSRTRPGAEAVARRGSVAGALGTTGPPGLRTRVESEPATTRRRWPCKEPVELAQPRVVDLAALDLDVARARAAWPVSVSTTSRSAPGVERDVLEGGLVPDEGGDESVGAGGDAARSRTGPRGRRRRRACRAGQVDAGARPGARRRRRRTVPETVAVWAETAARTSGRRATSRASAADVKEAGVPRGCGEGHDGWLRTSRFVIAGV